MTGHEKIASRNIRHAINWIVGGYYNCLQDDMPEDLPESYEALKAEIYDSAMQNLYAPGYEGCGKAPREMRFAGAEFCKRRIDELCRKDGDVLEIADYCGWEVE